MGEQFHFGKGHMCAGCDLSDVWHVRCTALEIGFKSTKMRRNGENSSSSTGASVGGDGGVGVVAEAAIAVGVAAGGQDSGETVG